MGYNTDFSGELVISPPLQPGLVKYINEFSESRRMKYDTAKLKTRFSGNHGYGGSYGIEGEYYNGPEVHDAIIDYNRPPKTQPGLWCNWEISDDGFRMAWNGSEKSYDMLEWAEYIIRNFIEPNGHTVNGEVEAAGEDMNDRWAIVVKNNLVIHSDRSPESIGKKVEEAMRVNYAKATRAEEVIKMIDSYVDLLRPVASADQMIPATKAIDFVLGLKNKLKDISTNE